MESEAVGDAIIPTVERGVDSVGQFTEPLEFDNEEAEAAADDDDRFGERLEQSRSFRVTLVPAIFGVSGGKYLGRRNNH